MQFSYELLQVLSGRRDYIIILILKDAHIFDLNGLIVYIAIPTLALHDSR